MADSIGLRFHLPLDNSKRPGRGNNPRDIAMMNQRKRHPQDNLRTPHSRASGQALVLAFALELWLVLVLAACGYKNPDSRREHKN